MMLFLKRLHKWVGLLIGIQLLLWLSSGLVISLLDPEKVSGRQWAQVSMAPTALQFGKLQEIAELPADLVENALEIELTAVKRQPIYRVTQPETITLINAITGQPISISEDYARTLAQDGFSGNAEIISVSGGTAPDIETRKHVGPYWRVDFSDDAQSSYYISAKTGDILERRNRFWRTHDFFWMLHIMDYQNREDFNNALVIAVALVAVWLGISGFILLFGSFGRHDFWFLNLARQPSLSVTLIDPVAPQPRVMALRKGGNLFLALANQGVDLPSKCGGGGECGRCKVKFSDKEIAEPNPVERKLLASGLIKKGFRLACQQTLTGDVTVQVPRNTLMGPEQD